jgi:hypothetical protein
MRGISYLSPYLKTAAELLDAGIGGDKAAVATEKML